MGCQPIVCAEVNYNSYFDQKDVIMPPPERAFFNVTFKITMQIHGLTLVFFLIEPN